MLFCVLFIWLFFLVKNPFFSVKMQSHTCVVDTNIIARWLQNYFQESFPEMIVSVENIVLKKKRLEIIAKTCPMNRKDLKCFLKKSQNEIAAVLKTNFNYDDDFILTLIYG
jgi:DNA-binding phage protein